MGKISISTVSLGSVDLLSCGEGRASGGVQVCKISKSAVPLEFGYL